MKKYQQDEKPKTGTSEQAMPKPGVQANESKPTNTPPAPGLDEAKHRAQQLAAHKGEVIQRRLFMMNLSITVSKGTNSFSTEDAAAYLERLMNDYGNPTNPTVCMLIEQLCMAHQRIGLLHSDASQTTDSEKIKILSAAAARLHAEFRKTAVALNELLLKQPSRPRLKIAQTA